MRNRSLLLSFALFGWGCGTAPPEGPRVVQRDSAGVVIIENPTEMVTDAGGWG